MSGLTVTDLFCGAGGSSMGAEAAGLELRLGLNHWKLAIETHATNFPNADHDCEDVSSLTTGQIRRYPDSDILLASPECTNHSLAKGARRRKPEAASLFDDGPAGDAEQDRSRATMWDVVRFAEQKLLKGKPYKAIVVENVVDAFKWGYNDDGGLFEAWRQAMSALGYDGQIVYLNSMFCPPTPQSRDRMYVVFWLRGMRRPDLDIQVPAWCVSCGTVVAGLQSWKKPDRPWGKYGAQYVYNCPDCHGAVIPGAMPAASAIDWTLPAQRIGDRDRPLAPATLDRIRRGLERLASEPFAIRLLQGGAPRPMTLPLVTLTGRHDMAMVLPVAGNTFERTPGNRARDPHVRPMDTIHAGARIGEEWQTTFGLVMANRAHCVPRPADLEAAQTLTTAHGGGICLVELQNHGTLRDATLEPAHTLRAGGNHHGVVVSNYGPGGGRKDAKQGDGGWSRHADELPFGTITASDGHALVVPYGAAAHGAEEPMRTQMTHDRSAFVAAAGHVEDCGFRMFELDEIARTMAMDQHPSGGEYVVVGNKRERMAQYGNAVTPPVMRLLVERLAKVLDSA